MYAQQRNNTRKTFNQKAAIAPYKCKVCHDAGKPASVYNSHFVRETPDKNSRVVCPTLLSMVCKYCYRKGHTPSACVQRQQDESSTGSTCDTASVSTWSDAPTTKPKTSTYRNNLYGMLSEDSDDDDDDNESIPSIESLQTDKQKSGYLMALLKQPPQPTQTASERAKEVFKGWTLKKHWADYDSDSDEE